MKRITLVFGMILIMLQGLFAQIDGKLVDVRDGKEYRTTKIGDQIWMAQNLDFQMEGSWSYQNNEENEHIFGRLYNWESAIKACPAGWHLPSDDEWQKLEKYLGMPDDDLSKTMAWRGTNQAKRLVSDSTLMFNLLYGGYRNPPSNYNLLKMQGFFWTSTGVQGSAWFRQMYEGSDKIFRRTRPDNWAFSVRCIKN